MRSTDVRNATVNVIFMTYRLEHDPLRSGQFRPKLVTVEGTSHAALQSAFNYKDAPQKEEFFAQIKRSLTRAVDLADLVRSGNVPPLEDHQGAGPNDPLPV